MIINKKIIAVASPLPVIILLIASTFYPNIVETVRAETGTANDIFKVILTIIGTNKADTGDVVAVVTVNDHSRVKFFNVLDNVAANNSLSEGDTSNSSSDSTDQGKLIEYVATFPNVTVNIGDEYKACALPLKTLKIVCIEGNNSPAKRPEFVDLSLGSTGSDKSQSSTDSFTTNQSAMIPSSSDETNNNADDEKHKKKNDDKLIESTNSDNDGTSPFIPQ
ncbi:MAG TPA: hypothetical protein VL854_00635 [Nitrososphaeraceae archaeon]|nr:hypothetical protein [Nitrososphaeraceae archaeon]